MSASNAYTSKGALLQHSLIAILLPFSFVAAVAVHLYPVALHEFFAAPPDLYLLVLAAVAVGQAASANALMAERVVGFAPRIRELILFLVVGYGVLVLLDGSVFQGDWSPLSAVYIYPLVLIVLLWLLAYSLHRALKRRELFLALIEGKDGRDLVNTVRDLSEESGDTESAITLTRRLSLVLLVFHLVVLLAALISQPQLSRAATALSLLQVATVFVVTVTANRHAEVHFLQGTGVVPGAQYRSRRNRGMVLITIVALAVAIPVSRDGAVISPQRIADALTALNDRINRRTVESDGPSEVTFDSLADESLGQDSVVEGGQGVMQTSDTIAAIARVVAIVIAGALGLGFLYFMIRPLLDRGKHERKGFAYYRSRLNAAFKRMGEGVRRFVAWLRERPQSIARTARTVAEQVRKAGEAREERRAARVRARERKREISADPYVRSFVRIVRWGAANGLSYRTSSGATTYLQRVADALPEAAPAAHTLARTLERAVYSPHDVEGDERAQFDEAVKTITRMRGHHG